MTSFELNAIFVIGTAAIFVMAVGWWENRRSDRELAELDARIEALALEEEAAQRRDLSAAE